MKLLAVCLLSAVVLPIAPAQALGPNDRRVSDSRSGISVDCPAGWTLSRHTGYTNTIVLLIHPDGSRISVSAARSKVGDARALYEQNRPGLAAQGLSARLGGTGPRGAFAVDLSTTGRAEKMRQLYLVREVPGGRQAVVLTLVANDKVFSAHTSALEFVVTRMGLDDPAPSSAAERARSPTSGAGGRSGS